MPEVVVGRCHGGWDPKDAYAQVPAGTTVYLFLDSFRTMSPDQADEATLLDVASLQALQSQASQTVGEYKTMPNYGIVKLEDEDVVVAGPLQEGVECVQEDGLFIKQIFERYKGNNIYWFACQSVMLYEQNAAVPAAEHTNQGQRF